MGTTATGSTFDNMPYLDQAEMAQNYGFALSFLKSYPEIYKIFQKAVNETWTDDKFIAALRGTSFYKNHAESWRNAEVLKQSDPQTYNNRIAQISAEISDKAANLGAPMSWTQIQAMAENGLRFGWNDAQFSDQIASYVQAVNGVYNGAVGDDIGSLRQTAWRNGISLSDATLQSYAQQIAKGSASRSFFERKIRQDAKTAAPGYADQLDSGMDLYDVASPYINSMAKILELNPQDIDLFDPTVRGALTATGADGKPTSKSLWQFENELRQDPRWLSTNNARDSVMGIAHTVLKDFGFSW